MSLFDNSKLPTSMSERTRTALETAGITFGDPIEDDPIFVSAQLPEGWRIESTQHSMGFHLVDEKGRNRANIFYKPEYYDRTANIDATTRYDYRVNVVSSDEFGFSLVAQAIDENAPIHNTEQHYFDDRVPDSYDTAVIAARAEVTTWLDTTVPEWRNPIAYWDEEK